MPQVALELGALMHEDDEAQRLLEKVERKRRRREEKERALMEAYSGDGHRRSNSQSFRKVSQHTGYIVGLPGVQALQPELRQDEREQSLCTWRCDHEWEKCDAGTATLRLWHQDIVGSPCTQCKVLAEGDGLRNP
jgi:hypothetical protein